MKKESEAVMEKETKQVEAPVRKTIPIQYPYMNEQSIQNVMIKQQLKIPFPVTVNSGTAAVHLALDIAGVGPGDEVITTSLTCAATNHAILMQYAKPVFADVQYDTGNIDPEDIEHRITPKTKAVLVVHWAGYPCDMDEINAIAKKHNLPVIEDAAHAMGASYKGKPMGTISDFTCFSLQAIKHITTGDGGILCTNNIQDYQKGIRRRWFGIDRNHRIPSVLGHADYDIVERGFKYHMNDIAAAIGLAQLPDLPNTGRSLRTFRESR
ncbi:DegT/DnrJ/EryC1/StrS family aminotransferase [Candidatus Woesearchaeota archaeon]|nr:DegT/DnrJ/EryC1/StrS family aminotransferase [Candidatus Woesearchaeota archaeon]